MLAYSKKEYKSHNDNEGTACFLKFNSIMRNTKRIYVTRDHKGEDHWLQVENMFHLIVVLALISNAADITKDKHKYMIFILSRFFKIYS